MSAARLEFCDRYGYPEAVREHFRRLLAFVDGRKVSSVILLGSTSRGELGVVEEGKEVTLFSDYELLVVGRGRAGRSESERLRREWGRLEEEIRLGSPLFHIDFAYVPRARLRRLPRRWWTYELRQRGIVVFGEDCTEELPEVGLENLDYQELNEVLIWRLWALLLHLPMPGLLTGQLETGVERRYRYLLAKNALDLTTWLLPLEGVLLPSFGERVAYLSGHFAELDSSSVMGADFPPFLRRCLQAKRGGVMPGSPGALYLETIGYFGRAARFLCRRYGLGDEGEDWREAVLRARGRLFREWRPRQKLRQLWRWPLVARQRGWARSLKWLLGVRGARLLLCLYEMHFAVAAALEGPEEQQAMEHLRAAARRCEELALRTSCVDGARQGFAEVWSALRRLIARHMADTYGVVGRREDELAALLASDG